MKKINIKKILTNPSILEGKNIIINDLILSDIDYIEENQHGLIFCREYLDMDIGSIFIEYRNIRSFELTDGIQKYCVVGLRGFIC